MGATMYAYILCYFFLVLLFVSSSLHALEFTVCARSWERALDNKLNAREIDANQYRIANPLLASFPGLFVRNEGAMTRVSIRGAKSDQTLVLINGIPMNDPSDPNNAFDFTNLEPEDIEDIKVYTGAEALEFGSSAIGGVIDITTKKGQGPMKAKGRVEQGSSQAKNATTSVQGENHEISYYINAVGKRVGRGSRFNPLHGNDVSDFNKDINAETRLGTSIKENWLMELYAHGDHQSFNVDGFPKSNLPEEIGNRGMKKSGVIALKNQICLLNNCWLHQVDASHMEINRHYWYPLHRKHINIEGQRHFFSYETMYKFTDCFKLMGETGWHQDKEKTHGLDHSLDHTYLKVKGEGFIAHQHCLTLSGRIDKTQKVTPHKTIQATASFRLLPTMILKANAGTGFRAPSIQDIFGFPPFQKPNFHLRPEKNKTIEVGIENEFVPGTVKTSLTSFYNHIHNIIVWEPTRKQVINRNHRVIKGIEAKALFNPNQCWSLILSYTFIHARDKSPNLPVLRQPKHKITFNVTWQALCSLQIFSGIVHESKRHDRTFLRHVTLPATTDVRMGANYLFTENFTLLGRIENLLDQKREKAFGYGRRRRSLYVGLKMEI
jgi:vitamin B12 transporter